MGVTDVLPSIGTVLNIIIGSLLFFTHLKYVYEVVQKMGQPQMVESFSFFWYLKSVMNISKSGHTVAKSHVAIYFEVVRLPPDDPGTKNTERERLCGEREGEEAAARKYAGFQTLLW